MERSPKPKIGILAEDKTDVDCIKTLVNRMSDGRIVSKGMGIGRFGNMFDLRKMTRFTRSLSAEGCSYLLVVHDLDREGATNELNDERQLRAKLAAALVNNPITRKAIIVPIEEIEAWLLSDKYPHPEKIPNPKNVLKKLNRNHRPSDNAKLAEKIGIDVIVQKCPSFRPLPEFLNDIRLVE
jgi:hypothetical protein